MMRTLAGHTALMFERSARGGRRDAATVLAAPTVLAILIVGLFDGLYGDIALAERYPATFFAWVAPAAILLSVLLGAGLSAATLITDIRSGYVDRLRLASVSPVTMLLGRVVFDAARGVATSVAVFVVTLLLGADAGGGLPGLAGLLALACGLAIAWNGIFFAVALHTLNPAVIQGLQPVTFMPAVMFSTFWVPPAVMPGWYRWISDHNPTTPVIDAARSLMLGTGDADAVATAAVVLVILAAITYAVAGRRLHRLLREA